MLKIALAAQAANAAHPEQVLLGLNHALCGKFQHHYVTAAYVYLDLEKRTLTYAGAGHPPLLLCRKSATCVQEVCENGLFLGKFDFATYTSVEIPLAPGDRILLYTDGIPETENAAQVAFGDERFQQLLTEAGSGTADQFADQLLTELSVWSGLGSGEELNDDITMVAVHIGEES
jgi:serine phosphatase RsbU (regulator of sigma subunit)